MNFFEQQAKAQSNSKKLVLLFTFAVVTIVLAVYFPIQYVMAEYVWNFSPRYGMVKDNPIIWSYSLFWKVALTTVGVIFIASFWKIRELAAGGCVIANMMNGRLIEPDTKDFKEKQLMNVVEEMSLASGIPTPNIYLMDREFTINAFAAGYTTGDAVIGVTRGTIDKLNREELQGVIAHEFSHILHGDMRLNIKLLGLLHGILVIGIIGRSVLSGTNRRGRRKGGGPLLLVGLALMIIGWIGYFFGKLIQAAVSRQREFLADASAVQYTRNTDGIGSALKKIGGYLGHPATGSHLLTHKKEEIAHMTFGSVNFAESFGWTSSHPPIEIRIAAIDPSFKPAHAKKIDALPHVVTQSMALTEDNQPSRKIQVSGMEIPVSPNLRYTAGAIAGLVGTMPLQAVDAQKQWLDALPEKVRDACHHLIKARAMIYILLAEYNDDEKNNFEKFLKVRDPHSVETFETLWSPVKELGPQGRLRLMDLCIPALRKLSKDEYKLFIQTIIDLIEMDRKMTMFEFLLMKTIRRHLNNYFHPQKSRNTSIQNIEQVEKELSTLLSAVAQANDNESTSRAAFDSGIKPLFPNLDMKSLETITIDSVDQALKKLLHTSFEVRQKVIEACGRTVLFDKTVTWREKEILRTICDALDCPIPHMES